ncbi:MFS family permease [Paenibacillus amylolyticus]|uniref:MFS family permease n=1 Tax=Paenibacillus amylolyticus TaxID=1451 RepID=A0AAP5H0H5_PAEAM|nr:MFS transporter [Paenibacillus amylolyticus]MDR6721666.1 MFS family permease [Paenibacillus amylolyticus]
MKLHYAWIIFIGCCIISFVGFGLTINTAGLFWGGMSEDLNLTRAEIALNATFNGIAGAVSLLFAGTVFKKINTKLLLSLSFGLTGLCFIACSFIQTIGPFYGIKVILGGVQNISIVISIPILLGNWFEKKLGMLFGITGALTAVGGSFFNPLISHFILEYGWRTTYIIVGVICLVVLLPVALLMKFKPENGMLPYGAESTVATTASGQAPQAAVLKGFTMKDAIRTPMFYCFIIAIICFQSAGSLAQHVPALIQSLNFSLQVGASVMSALLIGAAAGKLLMGFMLDHVKPTVVLLIFTIVGASGWYSTGVFNDTLFLNGSGFFSGMGQAIVLTAIPLLIRGSFGTKDYSQILSIILMFGAFSNAISVYVHGSIFDQTSSYSASLILNVTTYVIGFLCLISAIKLSNKMKTI